MQLSIPRNSTEESLLETPNSPIDPEDMTTKLISHEQFNLVVSNDSGYNNHSNAPPKKDGLFKKISNCVCIHPDLAIVAFFVLGFLVVGPIVALFVVVFIGYLIFVDYFSFDD